MNNLASKVSAAFSSMIRFSYFGARFPEAIIISLLAFLVSAQSTDDPDDVGTTTIAEIIPTATLTLEAGPATASTPLPNASVSPLAGHSYFWTDCDCYGKTDLPGWQNRGKYVEQAILDATEIADKSGQWPRVGKDASDLYSTKNFDRSVSQKTTSHKMEVILAIFGLA